MRLLNVRTLTLSSFFERSDSSDGGIPPYVILSHTWGDDEVTFEHIKRFLSDRDVQVMRGMEKIQVTCRQAKKDGFDWVWIDTCCIDKSSSAELSEAINSMYDWYARAAYCYVYLEDVDYNITEWDFPGQSIFQTMRERLGQYHLGELESLWGTPRVSDQLWAATQISASRWFTRGWTLQELLAPQEVRFFSQSGTFLGTKRDLITILAKKTGIPAQILADSSSIKFCSISKRMTWMRHRQTTRQEDLAYCLLGLFQVNMPLLYGEGHKAFYRLQRVILEASDDESLLAWEGEGMKSGPLAMFPSGFERGFIPSRMTTDETLPVLTSRGLTIKRDLYYRRRQDPQNVSIYKEEYMTVLNCKDGRGHGLCLLLCPVRNYKDPKESDAFFREGCGPVSKQELEQRWEHLGIRNLTISWGNSSSSNEGRVQLSFALYHEKAYGNYHTQPVPQFRSLRLTARDPPHDITLLRRGKYSIEAYSLHPFLGLYTCLFRFQIEIRHRHVEEAEILDLIIEFDHAGRGIAYLEKQTEDTRLSDQAKLQNYLKDMQEFILRQRQRPHTDQDICHDVFATEFRVLQDYDLEDRDILPSRGKIQDHYIYTSRRKDAVAPSFEDSLVTNEQTAQQALRRREQIQTAILDPEERRMLLPGSPDLGLTSTVKLKDSWLVVEVRRYDRMPGLGVNLWHFLLHPAGRSSIFNSVIQI